MNDLIKQIQSLKTKDDTIGLKQNAVIDKVVDIIKNSNKGNISDDYHTFNELYHHRAVLFSLICNQNSEIAWKSKLHDDNTMFDNMFIVGINTPYGQATYHYDFKPYWDYFKIKELEKAPKWDGHTPQQAIERLLDISRKILKRYGKA